MKMKTVGGDAANVESGVVEIGSVSQRCHNVVTELSSEKRVERARVRECVDLLLKRGSCAPTRVSMPRWDECLRG